MTLDVSRAPNRNALLAGALVDELARAGVRHFVVCPGSRSTPLVVALVALTRERPGLHVWSQIDERSAGFFALGIAKQSHTPAALVCTSGTAAANFFPAVIEASQSGVPLIVLSADRPSELRDWGAAQTIDQVRLYGGYARWFAELPLPEPTPQLVRQARAVGARAVAVARGESPGPVHLNCPFREPLEPVSEALPESLAADALAARGRSARAWTQLERAPHAPAPLLVHRLARAIAAAPRGVIAAGPLDRPGALGAAVARLARAAGWPILAEASSQLRCGAHAEDAPIAASYDLFLRNAPLAKSLAPQLVLRLGAPLTSKAFASWLASHTGCELWLADPDGRWADPTQRAAELLRFDPELLCGALATELERTGDARPDTSDWTRAFLRADRRAQAALDQALAEDDRLLGPRVVAELWNALPADATLFVSNSLPIRDVDAVFPASGRALRVLCNRGANGIDGIVSSALGAAAAGADPLVLLTGDLALLHDLGGLLAARRARLSATIVVLNNDGGGIFSALPVASHRDEVGFDTLFTTPHGLELEHAAALFGATHFSVGRVENLRLALKQSIGAPGLQLVEVPMDREQDVEARRTLFARVAQAAQP